MFCSQVLSRHPLEANLAGFSLETLPKYYFLNYNLVAMNLAHNYMAVSDLPTILAGNFRDRNFCGSVESEHFVEKTFANAKLMV